MRPIELVQGKAHSTGYYSQIQLAVGLSGFDHVILLFILH